MSGLLQLDQVNMYNQTKSEKAFKMLTNNEDILLILEWILYNDWL